MRVSLDTNVLVRYLVWDEATQSNEAARLIESAETIVLSTIVLCETVWVLRRAYKFQPGDIVTVLRDLTTMPSVEIDRPLVEAGITILVAGGDFADGAILAESERSKADYLASFDEKLASLSSKVRLMPPHGSGASPGGRRL
ncbi:MAG: type II toxin-antitoxin system VapC family toxin [Acidiphilium sp.]|nr:type II toxin-antitoxin system VapC family toxin [Acidiphilium sp.]